MMNDNYYTSGKQYQVKCSSVITPDNKGNVINFDLVLKQLKYLLPRVLVLFRFREQTQKALWSNDMLVPFDEESEKEHTLLLMPGITVFITTEMYLTTNLNSIRK